jgi:protocatechuate 3,4-dioxygenase beta subunit
MMTPDMPGSTQSASSTANPSSAASPSRIIRPYSRPDPNTQPPSLYLPYRSTAFRAPSKPLISFPNTLSEVTGPVFGQDDIAENDNDLTRQHASEPIGQRITVQGRVIDDKGRPVPKTLVEIWQTNAGGRYVHENDQHRCALDPNFTGCGRTLTDAAGNYRFVTIKPGAYPWRNHPNAWRPAHIHFSLFGTAFTQRLVTQMYFPDDPLFPFDPIYNSIPDERARKKLVSRFELELTEPEWSLGFRWDIVLRGQEGTPFEE